jgi:hypothetical protein
VKIDQIHADKDETLKVHVDVANGSVRGKQRRSDVYVVKKPATRSDYIRIYGMKKELLTEARKLEKEFGLAL